MEEPPIIPTGARRAILAELSHPGSLALLFMATALALVTIFVLPEWKLPAAWPATFTVLFLTLIWIAMAALRRSLSQAQTLAGTVRVLEQQTVTTLPKVIRAMLTPGQEEELVLLLQPNRLFGQFMLVSIYYEDERGFELLVGQGEVGNVQSDGAIQITVTSWEEPYQHVRRVLIAQDADTLKRLLVRPAPSSVPDDAAAYTTALQLLIQQNASLRKPGNG